jgi:hypothetical protein
MPYVIFRLCGQGPYHFKLHRFSNKYATKEEVLAKVFEVLKDHFKDKMGKYVGPETIDEIGTETDPVELEKVKYKMSPCKGWTHQLDMLTGFTNDDYNIWATFAVFKVTRKEIMHAI